MLSSADMITDTHLISVFQPSCWHLYTLGNHCSKYELPTLKCKGYLFQQPYSLNLRLF